MAIGMTNSTGISSSIPVYTIAKDRTVSDPATRVTYLDDAADFTIQDAENLYMEHNRPCVYRRSGNGGVAYYLKWNDWSKKSDNTSSNLTGADGDVCIEMDRLWWKAWRNGNFDMFSWTYENPTGILNGFKPWAHYKGMRDTVPHYYAGAFKFAENSSRLGSYVDASAKPARSQNMTSFEANCKKGVDTSLNTAEYTLMRMPQYTLIREMHDFVSKNTGSQTYFGKGIVSVPSASEATLKPNSEGYNATGMMKSGTTADGEHGVNSLGFNNLWGNVYEFCGQTVYGNRHFKCNYLNDPESYASDIASRTYANVPSTWYETKTPAIPYSTEGWKYSNADLCDGPCAAMAAEATQSAGTETYYCDGTYMPTSATNNCVLFSGALTSGADAGLRCCVLTGGLSYSYWSAGARLLIIPPV